MMDRDTKLIAILRRQYHILLFHYDVILPYKVKRRRKIWGRNTL